jgi:hypothetical protein
MPGPSSSPQSGRNWFLILAHPGHELRVHHLLERFTPTVAVITDGSGSTGVSRLGDSRQLLSSAGAQAAELFGPLTDRDAYRALMDGNAAPFSALIERLANAVRDARAQCVLIDAAEGYNPVHDVCHWIGRAVASRARFLNTDVELFEIDLVAHPEGDGDGLRITLDDRAFERKLAAASRYHTLAAEAATAFGRYGQDAFRTEFVRRVGDASLPPAAWKPHYEQVGEERVKAGLYPSVLRFGAHVRPLIESVLDSERLSRADTVRGGLNTTREIDAEALDTVDK